MPLIDFHSILSNQVDIQRETEEQPDYFNDLNLDQVINAVTEPKQEYNLKPFFYTPLHDARIIHYRQEVMAEMEKETQQVYINTFSRKMARVRNYLAFADSSNYNYHKQGWFLEAVLMYCEGVTELASNLVLAGLKSNGFLAFLEYITAYIDSPDFQSLIVEADQVKKELSGIKYCLIIENGRFRVRRYEDESDYTVEVERTFEKFKQGAVKDFRVKLSDGSGMNHIEAKIIEFVARLYPETFAVLDQFCEQHGSFLDQTICTFDREIQFYVAYLEFISHLKQKGLLFCYPEVSSTSRNVFCNESFDIALAHSLLYTEEPLICNDFYLANQERIIVVSGPNQGGKTTFARMFGQLHYLASLGCPVPGWKAKLFLFDQIFSHFEREEDIRNLRGKLQDDLMRIHDILTQVTPNSILIVNEMFVSTTLKDAVFLSKEIMAKVLELDLLCVWVTFIDELSSLSEKTISMVSTVVPENPDIRTFKIVRKPADGLAYAQSIAEKHRLTYRQIKERIQS